MIDPILSKENGNQVLKAALDYARRVWPVFPLWWSMPNGQCACGNPSCSSIGKHPISKGWQEQATTDEAIIKQLWKRWPNANIGILAGERSGILLLDVDLKDDGPTHLAELETAYGALPDTVESLTGSGGKHVLFKYPTGREIPNIARFYTGLDTRSNGGLFVAPCSLHASGRRYDWKAGHHPDDVPLADAPSWLLNLMATKAKAKAAQPIGDFIPEGERNSTLTSLAGSMRHRGMSHEGIEAALMAENEQRCLPPLDDNEVKSIAASVSRYPPGAQGFIKTKTFNLTDLGNARRLVAQHGQDIRYCHIFGCWFLWDGRRWIKDTTGGIYRLAKKTVASIYEEAANAIDSEERKAIAKHATKSESEARINAMIALAESEPGITVTPDQMDDNPWLLNCLNGTLDLQRGILLPHNREDLITKLVPTVYDVNAECPTWIKFLKQILQDIEDLITFLQKAVGYCLTGDTREQVLFFLFGIGANGKSTLINIMMALLGDYAMQTPTETLMLADRGGIPNDIARLKGARFVAAVEAGEGRRMAEVLVKQLTGGDKITARFLHQEFFEYVPQCKIFLAANHKPVIKGTDQAIWRRIKMLPFTMTIPEEQQDKQLLDKLKAELPGILVWAVKGCLAWQKSGLGAPEEVTAATDGYRAEMDVIAGYIDEKCHIHPAATAQAGEIYGSYCQWCRDNGEKEQSQRKFGSALTERGFQRARGVGGRYLWRGIGLSDIPGEAWA